ncbi:MAG: hypothetical protein H7A25_14620 [Leptospiraceae bacterium]|nr:hypothetical protein [Leptospiraceae bacterium]
MSVYLGILISFLGLVALQYSERYLAGERRQGYFYKWMAVSIGSILSFVSSDNLIVFAISWSLSSWGLHSLLTFYPEKAAGTLSAWKKFYISRLGDLFLGIATILCYMEFKTLQLDRIFSIIQSGNFTREYTELIGLFLALGALTKSAQLPFHTWLPDTMESPTPVSALMHAGIINAGGVLLIKLSPLMNLSAMGLNLLVIFGGITAFVASIIMLTETSIKKSLAYSTISQMGLMILQCGLGAYSLAMVHIIGHSFYKAYSFLSANSILQKEYYKNPLPGIWEKLSFSHIGVSVFLSIGIYFLVKIILGIDILEKKGLLVLAPTFIMSLIFFFKLRLSFLEFSLKNLFYSIFAMILFTGLYTMLCLFFETVVPVVGIKSAGVSNEIQMFILILLSLVFLLQLTVKFWSQTGFGRSFYIHTRNGFYMDIVFSKLIKPFVPDVKLEKR